MTELENKELYYLAFDKMSYYLGARDHSLQELYKKLSKNFPKEVINQVLEKAIEHGWILPPKEMAKKTAQVLHRKNKGYLYISNYLRQKGLPTVDKEEDVEIQKACAIISHHFHNKEKLEYNEKQKAIRLLKNRGFDHQTIKNVIYEIY